MLEDGEQTHIEVLARCGVDDHFFHGTNAGYGESTASLAELFWDASHELMRVCVGADEPDNGADAGVESSHAVGYLRLGMIMSGRGSRLRPPSRMSRRRR